MDATLAWILGSGLAMSLIALVGGGVGFLPEALLRKIVQPLAALAAGSLLGGALFHMLPESLAAARDPIAVFEALALGLLVFFGVELLLHGRHGHELQRRPLGTLILIADGLHNLLGGVAVGAAFLIDIRLGVTTWIAAAAHEVPQEIGDFAVLLHSGWSRRRALVANFLSGLTFPLGGLIAWGTSRPFAIDFLLPFAAGNFVYIAAADLLPEVKAPGQLRRGLLHLAAVAAGLALLLVLRRVAR